MNKLISLIKLHYLIIIVLLVISFLRLYKLGSIPNDISADELSFGYEGYSIAQTGHDSWGKAWPLFTRSYGDDKAPGLVYSLSALFRFLPLSLTTVRLPSALSSIFVLPLLYLIFLQVNKSKFLAALWTFIIGASYWFSSIGRVYLEASGGLVFLLIQFSLLFLNFKKLNKSVYLGMLTGLIAGYWYPPYLFVSLGITVLYLVLNSYYKLSLVFIGIYMLVLSPLLINYRVILTRANQESSKRMEEITLLVDEQRRLCHVISQGQFSKFCYAMWNKPIMRTTQIISTTLNTIFPENLGLAINEKALLSTSSSTYPFAFTLIYIFGLVLVIKSSRQDKRLQFLLLVYLGAVLVSASTGVVTIHRNLLGLVLSGIIAYYGYSVLVKNSSTLPFKIGIASITLVLLFQETQALTHYFFVQPAVETINNEYHYRQIANFMALHHGDNISYYDNHVLYPGATMYSFFSGLSPVKYRQSITYTNVNENGNIWPISVEGYTPTDLSLDKLVCTVTTPEAYYISKYDPTLVAYQVVGTNVHGLPTPLYAIYDLVKLKAIAYPGKCN